MVSKLMVLKRNGSEEEFIYEKLVVSLLKVGIPLDDARMVARLIECRIIERGGKASTAEIAKWVLSLLKNIDEEFYRKWVEAYKRDKGVDLEKELEAKLYYYEEPVITP